jgi:hypothetical protein
MGTVATQASMSLDGYIDLLDRRQAPAQPTALRCSSFRHDLREYPYESVMVAIPVTCDNDTSIADPAGPARQGSARRPAPRPVPHRTCRPTWAGR